MIGHIKIKNFKCFKYLNINCGKLNVFSGLNGMGKSTTLQALLLMKQSKEQNFIPQNVCLSGNYVNLGVGKDVLYEDADKEIIEIEIDDSGMEFSISIKYNEKLDVLPVEFINNQEISFLNGDFEYLNAERMSPQVTYPKSSFFIETKAQLGINGQFTAHYLSKKQDEKITWDSCIKPNLTIKEAVQFWLNEISPNVKLDAMELENTDSAKIGFYYIEKEKSKLYRPTNVGFGISYILPVIVALIKARENTTLIIENPEAHLHPKGQRKMGELIARCAASGAQIFVETHSDHVLNGIRIATKNKLISNKHVKLFYFSKEKKDKEIMHTVQTPILKENGKIDYWPEGFFDEWEKALDEIL
ncbi:DUF3696 domain-containing protein [Lacrimispora sp.]|uniref:DUF3696 domain-containing protein n=1 Tax=Lacrimispora sp. TaxID=2719234 RepID=UPI0032E46C1B